MAIYHAYGEERTLESCKNKTTSIGHFPKQESNLVNNGMQENLLKVYKVLTVHLAAFDDRCIGFHSSS